MINTTVHADLDARQILNETIAEITERERTRREHVWSIRRRAAEACFGPSVLACGGWTGAFQSRYRKIIDGGRDMTAIPGYDTLVNYLKSDFPEFDAEDGTERLWDLLFSPHNPMPKKAAIREEAAELVEQRYPGLLKTKRARRARRRIAEVAAVEQTIVESTPPAIEVAAVVPAHFNWIRDLARARRNILLVGPAGCGKSHVSKLVADSLGLSFGAISCTAGMSEAHLLGRAIPDFTTGRTRFQSTEFLRCYEQGGVFLLDEIDAADSNMLLVLNAAIANGYLSVPNRDDAPVAKRHPDFVLIATANTFGRGANRVYAGRNQLDESTLDRYRIGTVEMDYDATVEAQVCPDSELRKALQSLRERIVAAGLRRILSTRFLADAQVMHDEAGWSVERILDAFFQGWTNEELAKCSR